MMGGGAIRDGLAEMAQLGFCHMLRWCWEVEELSVMGDLPRAPLMLGGGVIRDGGFVAGCQR